MKLLHNLFNNDNNSTPANSDAFLDIVNSFSSDDRFNCDDPDVIRVSNDVFSVVTYIANAISNLPIISDNQYLQNLINNDPNPYQTGKSFISSLVLNMLIYGDAFALITTDKKTGLVSRLDLLPSSEVTININNNGLSYYYAVTGQTFNDKQVLKFSLPSTDGIHGIPPLYALKNVLRLDLASNRTLHEYYLNGLFGKSIISINDNLSDDEKENIKEQFKRSLQNSGYGGSIIQDNNYIKDIKPYSTTSNGGNSGFIKDTKTINDQIKRDVCHAFNVPSSLLCINSHANTSDEMSRFHSDIESYETIISSTLSKQLSGNWKIGNYIDVNTCNDVATLAKSGAITPAQAQQLLGLTSNSNSNNNTAKTNNK